MEDASKSKRKRIKRKENEKLKKAEGLNDELERKKSIKSSKRKCAIVRTEHRSFFVSL